MTTQSAALRQERAATKRADQPTMYWAFWIVWVLAAIVVEFIALFRSYQASGTLSEFWRSWVTGVHNPKWEPAAAIWAGRIVTLAFCFWLGPHLAFGWWG